MCVLNELDRFSLAIDAIDRVPQLGSSAAHVRQELVDKIIEHKHYIRRYGEDMPEIAGWVWRSSADKEPSTSTTSPGVIATAGDNV
jgi:xylulose-5-phosphate/fructose-6-phosphate phosphoketolase